MERTLHQSLDRVRAHHDSGRPSFHAFEYRGHKLLYGLSNGVLVSLSPSAYKLLGGLETGRSDAKILSDIQRADPGLCVDEVLEEVQELFGSGLFSLRPPLERGAIPELVRG